MPIFRVFQTMKHQPQWLLLLILHSSHKTHMAVKTSVHFDLFTPCMWRLRPSRLAYWPVRGAYSIILHPEKMQIGWFSCSATQNIVGQIVLSINWNPMRFWHNWRFLQNINWIFFHLCVILIRLWYYYWWWLWFLFHQVFPSHPDQVCQYFV